MATNPAQGMTPQQLANFYNQGYANQATTMLNAAHGIHGINYGQLAQQIQASALTQQQWVFDGKPCTIAEFAEKCFGDTAERDVFLLKYTKIGELE